MERETKALKQETEKILEYLKSKEDLRNREGMARFGINSDNAFGVKIPVLRGIAKEYRKNHLLAESLWQTKIHEARLLAIFVEDPRKMTAQQIDDWVRDLNSWDLCDQFCIAVGKTAYAYSKALEWVLAEEEFIKRAGFSLIAVLAIHDKKAPNENMLQFLPLIEKAANDERNFVKKAVNWSLRQIGKKNLLLNTEAIKAADRIARLSFKSAQWIGNDALKELTSEKVKAALKKKAEKN